MDIKNIKYILESNKVLVGVSASLIIVSSLYINAQVQLNSMKNNGHDHVIAEKDSEINSLEIKLNDLQREYELVFLLEGLSKDLLEALENNDLDFVRVNSKLDVHINNKVGVKNLNKRDRQFLRNTHLKLVSFDSNEHKTFLTYHALDEDSYDVVTFVYEYIDGQWLLDGIYFDD